MIFRVPISSATNFVADNAFANLNSIGSPHIESITRLSLQHKNEFNSIYYLIIYKTWDIHPVKLTRNIDIY